MGDNNDYLVLNAYADGAIAERDQTRLMETGVQSLLLGRHDGDFSIFFGFTKLFLMVRMSDFRMAYEAVRPGVLLIDGNRSSLSKDGCPICKSKGATYSRFELVLQLFGTFISALGKSALEMPRRTWRCRSCLSRFEYFRGPQPLVS